MIIKIISSKDLPSKHKVTNRRMKKFVVSKTVEYFLNSSDKYIEIIDDEELWSNSNNFRRSFQSYLDNHNIEHIAVTIRGNRVFLIKTVYNNNFL